MKWMFHVAKCGCPITKEALLESVQIILRQMGRVTPFTNGKPGRHWYELFLERHPEISQRVTQNLTKARSSVTELKVRGWFSEIQNYIDDNNIADVWNDPKRIFNCDESASFLSPKGERVLVKKGDKAIYSFINNDEKECVTTLVMSNAAGDLPYPMVIP
ncbi:hypothetical protein JTB14_013382 [Gonioctena quinquepunctata]|nr:hypothetical protein JTB14_013382 [Gonioctena quinquepunctata]